MKTFRNHNLLTNNSIELGKIIENYEITIDRLLSLINHTDDKDLISVCVGLIEDLQKNISGPVNYSIHLEEMIKKLEQ